MKHKTVKTISNWFLGFTFLGLYSVVPMISSKYNLSEKYNVEMTAIFLLCLVVFMGIWFLVEEFLKKYKEHEEKLK